MKQSAMKAALAMILALSLQMAVGDASSAIDLLAQAKQLSLPAKAYPELTQINDQVSMLIMRMENTTNQLKEYRKQRVRGSDRRYSALTRDLNQTRSRLSEVERKLEKAPSLDTYRFAMPVSAGDRGSSSSSDARSRAMAGENKKYDEVKSQLRLSLKAMSDHYDQQLKEIARVK
jgi:uncharacterized protein (DUF58 family)